LDGEYIRDEAGQAANIREVLEISDAEGVDSTFIWLFELCNFPIAPMVIHATTSTSQARPSSRPSNAATETPTPT
jgi:hypothetical protein